MASLHVKLTKGEYLQPSILDKMRIEGEVEAQYKITAREALYRTLDIWEVVLTPTAPLDRRGSVAAGIWLTDYMHHTALFSTVLLYDVVRTLRVLMQAWVHRGLSLSLRTWMANVAAAAEERARVQAPLRRCLAALMNDWAGRDASCEAAAAGDAKTPASVVKKRLLLLLTQYYTSSSEVSAHRRELIEEPGADIAARRVRRAGSQVPEAKEFCIFQYARFVSTHSQTLFDSTHCGGKHPLWSEMESCEKTQCWDKQIEPILKDGGGCLALYYDLYFSMVCGHESAGAQRVPA